MSIWLIIDESTGNVLAMSYGEHFPSQDALMFHDNGYEVTAEKVNEADPELAGNL